MPAFSDSLSPALHTTLDAFRSYIDGSVGFHNVRVMYMNAEHLCIGQPESLLPDIKPLLMYLLNEYMPTGILRTEEVESADNILHQIKILFYENRAVESVLSNLSDRFYECIPQNGLTKRLQTINNLQMYRNKVEVLIRLRSALESLSAGVQSTLNPIDYFGRYWLRSYIHKIRPDHGEFQALNECTTNTQHPNDREFTLTNVFKVSSEADSIYFRSDIPNPTLLYHFTFPCNIPGILREGLMVAPNHIYSGNRYLGRGIYFWDCASMALKGFRNLNTAVLLVCRVALGNIQEEHDQYLDKDEVLPLGPTMHSILCQGSTFHATRAQNIEIGGSSMYSGRIAEVEKGFPLSERMVEYNRYLIQQNNQVKVEYILQFEKVNKSPEKPLSSASAVDDSLENVSN